MKIQVVVKEVYFVSRVIEAKNFADAEAQADELMKKRNLLTPMKGVTVEDQERTEIAWMTKEQ